MKSIRAVRVVFGAMVVAAACAIASTAAAHADPVPARALPDHPAASTADPSVAIPVAHATLRTFERLVVPRTACPAEAPLLSAVRYTEGTRWRVPNGIEIVGTGGAPGLDADIIGYGGDLARPAWIGDGVSAVVNWARADREVRIIMHCVRPWRTAVSHEIVLAPHEVAEVGSLSCPAGTPYLSRARSALPPYIGWQYVFVSGVRITDAAFRVGDAADSGAILRASPRRVAGYETGIGQLTVIARDRPVRLDITLFCTDRPAAAATL